ncbi:unnamed protein product [Caenorhabditis nigoni]
MPLLNKQPFIPKPPPNGIPPDTKTYYCQPTGEIFLSHEEYFARMILLNTTAWSCALTRKSNLTYFEAQSSEKETERDLGDFPESLELPVFFIVHKLTNRGRFEELVNDVYHIMKDRYFNNEEVSYLEKSRKTLARIVTSHATQQGITDRNGLEMEEAEPGIKEPIVQNPEDFRYTVEILEGVVDGDADRFRENVTHDKLFRSKTFGARQKIRLFLKNTCHLPPDSDRYTIRDEYLDKVDGLWWSDIMSGAEPICPKTPVLQRGRIPNLLKSGIEGGGAERRQKREDRDPDAPPRPRGRPPKTPEQRALLQKEKKPRKRPEDTSPRPLDDFDLTSSGALTLSCVPSTSSASEEPVKKKVRRSSTSSKTEKKKAKIQEQQEDLTFYFDEARRFGIDLTGLEQEDRLLSPKKISEFKMRVKEQKDVEREALKEERKRKIREKAAYNKKRDDLICNDLKPLPRFPSLEIPKWMTTDEFGDYLFILQFFTSFREILPLKEVRGTDEIQLSEIIIAMKCFDPQNSPFADLMKVLLTIRTDIADEEDGDEADFQNREEIYLINAQNCDPVHVTHGDSIREISEMHFRIRKIHGKSVRHLPVDWMTLTEVLRLILLTSGYYTGVSTHRHRLYQRGNFRGYEDPAFELRQSRPDIMEKLRTQTVFDLEPSERLEIMKTLIYQLLTYSKFRSHMEKQQIELAELKKEQKRLKAWDLAQEQEANASRLLLEIATPPETASGAMSSVVKKFKGHLKAFNEGRRFDKEEMDGILLDAVPYTNLTLDEIVTARDLQKSEFKLLMDSLTSKLFSTYCKVSDIRLGSDRAYRRYLVLENLSAILVETPTSSELRVGCDEASKIDDPQNLENSEDSEVFLCSGDVETCDIHGSRRSNNFCYIKSREQFERLLKTLNPRGNRENELLEELLEYRSELLKILEDSEAMESDGSWREMLMTDEADPADTYNIDWDTEIRDLLLDFEEKLDQGQMGSIEKVFEVNRWEWRQQFKDSGDVTELLKVSEKNIQMLNDLNLDLTTSEEMSDSKKLAIGFFSIIRSIQMKFIKPPYLSPNKDEHGRLKPSELFIRWQKALLQCESHSALSLFITTFESSIKWDKSRLQGKCKSCRKKASAHDLILCSECDSCYHLKCAKLKEAPSDWKCPPCRAQQRKLENEAKREAAKEQHLEIPSNDVSLMSIQDEQSSSEDPSQNTIRTASGRAVKKVQYQEVHEGVKVFGSPKTTSRKSINGSASMDRPHRNVPMKIYDMDSENGMIDDEDYSEDGENSKKRKSQSTNAKKSFSTPAIMDSSIQKPTNKEKMALIETLLKETMRQECSWPFLQPVDPKEVPDYHEVIKQPMDLRTMMNKIKQRVYNKPAEIRTDFQQILTNCETYNETESEIFQLSRQLEDFVTARLDSIIDQ